MIISRKNSGAYLALLYFLLWILVFEVILPLNNTFPKPSVVFQSILDLFKNYDMGWNYLSTLSAIYLSLIAAYYLIRILFPILLHKTFLGDVFLSVEWFSRYIPGIILAMILMYWFPQSEATKFVFAFLVAFSSTIIKAKHLGETLGSEYSLSLKSFGINDKSLSRKVVWKAIQPQLMRFIIEQNIYLWASVILFEYINLGFGTGTVLRKILQYKDISALVMMFILIGISIFISTQLLKLIKNKFYF